MSMSRSVCTSLVSSRPAHRQRGRVGSLPGNDNHRVAGMLYRADLLRGMPGPRGLEFWRWCVFPRRKDLGVCDQRKPEPGFGTSLDLWSDFSDQPGYTTALISIRQIAKFGLGLGPDGLTSGIGDCVGRVKRQGLWGPSGEVSHKQLGREACYIS